MTLHNDDEIVTFEYYDGSRAEMERGLAERLAEQTAVIEVPFGRIVEDGAEE